MLDRIFSVSDAAQSLMYPAIAMAMLTFVAYFVLAYRRLNAIKLGEYPMRYFKLYHKPADAQFPEKAEAASRHYTNLFESPVLFYALVPLLILAGVRDSAMSFLLWAFVAARCVHSYVHLTSNHIMARFIAFTTASIVLFLAWLRFAMILLTSG